MNRDKLQTLPQFLRPFLWSYDLSRLDAQEHKDIIIKNILDFGNVWATDWMKSTYTENEIKEVIRKSVRSSWSKKSINFWSFIYGVSPKETRF
jgi:hypothetical protein